MINPSKPSYASALRDHLLPDGALMHKLLPLVVVGSNGDILYW